MSARSLYAIECSDCDAVVVCDVVRDMMDIRGLDGWTFPPVRCPSCSVAASVSHSSVAIGSECQWCHCVGYHSEVCKGFEINDAARAAVVSHPRPERDDDPLRFPYATIVEISRDNTAHALDEHNVWLCVGAERGALPNSSLLGRCTYGEALERKGPRGEPWPPWPCQTCASRASHPPSENEATTA